MSIEDPLNELKRATALMGMTGALQVITNASRAMQEHHAKCPTCALGKRCADLDHLLDHAKRVLAQAATNYRAQFVGEDASTNI